MGRDFANSKSSAQTDLITPTTLQTMLPISPSLVLSSLHMILMLFATPQAKHVMTNVVDSAPKMVGSRLVMMIIFQQLVLHGVSFLLIMGGGLQTKKRALQGHVMALLMSPAAVYNYVRMYAVGHGIENIGGGVIRLTHFVQRVSRDIWPEAFRRIISLFPLTWGNV